MTDLKIVLAPSAYYPHVGGIEELTRQLASALTRRGHSVSVLTNRWPEGVPPVGLVDATTVHRLRFPLPSLHPVAAARFLATGCIAAAAMVRHLRHENPDVVHVIGAGPQSVYLAWLRSSLSARVVFTAQGELTFDPNGVFQRSVTLRHGLRRMLRTADAVTCCSTFALGDLRSFSRVAARAFVIPNAVNPNDFAEVSPPEVNRGSYVLAIGRLVPQKGLDVLLEAFAIGRFQDLNLVIAGEGAQRPTLEKLARELGIATRVTFLGAVGRVEIPRLLAGATAFAFPSRGEPFGIALLEAMACGVPAVAAATGGVCEFACHGQNALLVEPDDARALANALTQVIHDEALRVHLVRGGHRTAEEFTWSNISRRYELLYRSVLAP